MHPPSCTCSSLFSIAQKVLTNEFVLLAEAYRSAFPQVTYHSITSKQCVLRMPLVAIRVGPPESGVSQIYLFEHEGGVNFWSFLHLLNSFHHEKSKKILALTKQELQGILSIAQSDSEREAIRYTAFKASGL